MKKHTLILLFSLLFITNSFARIIEGYVYDNDEQFAMPSFQVLLLGGEKIEFTYTDENGHFEFYVPNNDTVHIRFQNIGFVTMDIVDVPNQKHINIGKVYIHLNSYLRSMSYNEETQAFAQSEPRINPKKMILICPNEKKVNIPLTKLFREVQEDKNTSLRYKENFGLKRQEFYYLTYQELSKKL